MWSRWNSPGLHFAGILRGRRTGTGEIVMSPYFAESYTVMYEDLAR